jgi:hypothetical protein
MIIVTHQAIGIAEPAQTVDDLGEKGAPLRSIVVVTTMSCGWCLGDMVHGPRELNS